MTPIVSEHKLPKMRFGHVNIANLGDIEQNYVAANRDEAMAAFERMLDLAAELLVARAAT